MIRQSQAEVHTAASGSTVITEQLICEFVGSMQLRGCRPDSVKKYRHDLSSLYDFLPGEKRIGRNTLREWRAALAGEGYAPRTINAAVSVANSFLAWLGLREYQLPGQLSIRGDTQPALTRNEYLRLLSAARTRGRERLALLMETICATGIRVSEVRYLTVEAARRGRAEIALKGKIRTILIPAKLCRKLLQYARKQNTASGEIFLTRGGKGLSRKQIWAEMKALCQRARVRPTKVFPHNLRHLFARTFYRVCRDVAKLADVLGHSSIETTRIYLISTGAEHARTLDRLRLIL